MELRTPGPGDAERMIGKLDGIGIDIGDLEANQLPVIIPCVVSDRILMDMVRDRGCLDVGLDSTYPLAET